MATTYISRTFGTATNRKKWTMSVWVKKTSPLDAGVIFSSYAEGCSSGSCYSAFRDNGSSTYDFTEYDTSSYIINLRPSPLLRDPAAWYHFVLAYDSTQGVAADRVNYYINGVLQTAWGTETYPTLNQESGINQAALHTIGKNTVADSGYFNGVMTHFNFIDGLQYAASDFGEFDSVSGIWKLKTAPSVTYGNNGFFLKMEDRTNLDLDSSLNAHTFTTSGNLTATYDSCSNNFCTMNSLDIYYGLGSGSGIFTQGNTTVTSGAGNYAYPNGTMALSSGKWYWEVEQEAVSGGTANYSIIGIVDTPAISGTFVGKAANSWGYFGYEGKSKNNSVNTTYGDTFTTGDIIGVYLDLDNSKLYFAKDGVIQNSGTGLSITAVASTAHGHYVPAVTYWDDPSYGTFNLNFGNGYMGTTLISSPEADVGGIGAFKYDPSVGTFDSSSKDFRAICTKNIKVYG